MRVAVGQRYGRLLVLARARSIVRGKRLRIVWQCACDCGSTRDVVGCELRRGSTRSCGCLHLEGLLDRSTTHGRTGTPTYKSWAGLVQRCTNNANPDWAHYGGRGITLAARWRQFSNFLADMGERPPGTTIERVDNDRGYEPDNCVWGTRAQQALNRRTNKLSRGLVDEIRGRLEHGESVRSVAARIGISEGYTRRIHAGDVWPEARS